jgi:hypothetical protein
MALTDWSPAEIQELQAKGIDPRYASPTTNAPVQQPPSIPQTIGRTAVAHGGSYLGGGAGAIGGGSIAALAAPWLLGPEAGLPADALILGGGILGAGAGAYGGQKAQQAIENPETYAAQQQAAEEAAQTNPKTALATDIAGSALASGGTLSPSTAARGVRDIIGTIGGKALTQEAKNVLLQSALNPAINTGLSLAQGQGMPTIGSLAEQAGGGALFAKSWLPSGRFHAPDEPTQEVNNNTKSLDESAPGYVQPATTPFKAQDEQGNFKIGDKQIKNLFMRQFAPLVPKDIDPVMKAQIQTVKDRMLSQPVADMREALHQQELNNQLKEPSTEDPDYQGGALEEQKGLNENAEQPIKGTVEGLPATTPGTTPQVKQGTTPQAPQFTQEILQKIIDKGATKPVAVQRIFPKLNLSEQDATEALRQADLLAELHLFRPTEEGEQNATGVRENKGQPNQERQISPSSEVRSGGNMVEQTSGSKESVPPQVGSLLPKQETPNPLVLNPVTGEKSRVNSALSDYNRYQELVKQTQDKTLPREDREQAAGELLTISDKYGGKPPPAFPEHHVLNPVMLQNHILSGKATTGSILHSLANTPDHPFAPLAKELLSTADTKSLGVPWQHDPTLDKTNDRRSHYDTLNDQVNIGTGTAGDSRSVMEEVVHSLTSRKTPAFGGKGKEYYTKLQNYLKNSSNVPLKDLIQSYLDTAHHLGIENDLFGPNGTAGEPDLTQKSNLGLGSTTKYAMGHLDEFLAQAFKDPEFQRLLDGIKTTDGRTLFQKIIDAVRDLLGLSPKAGSMLDRVLRSSSELISQQRPERNLFSRTVKKSPDEVGLPKDRYMGKIGLITRAVIDKVRDIGTPQAKSLGDHFQQAVDKETELKGQWKNLIVQAGEKLNAFDKRKVQDTFDRELVTKKPATTMLTNAAQRAFYKLARAKLDESGKYRLAIGEPVMQAISKGGRTIYIKRDLRQDPLYFPGMANQKVMDTYRQNVDQAKIAELDKQFNDYNTKELKLTPQESEERIQNFKTALQGSIKNSDISHQDYFNAHRKAEGSPLPPTFREQDPVRNLERYFDRAAIDASHYQYLEKNPSILASLGQTKDAWGNDIPKTANTSIANNPSVKEALAHWRGEARNPSEYNEASISSLISSTFIAGPALELHKVVSNVVKSIAQTSNPVTMVRAVTHAMTNIASGYQHAVENGVVKLTSRSVSGMVTGTYTAAERLQSAARLIRKISTFDDLTTKVGAGLVQSMNEVIIPSKILRANNGSVTDQLFVKRLDPTYIPGKQYSDQEMQALASRSANYIHGTGDIRSLPGWMLKDSEFSGFFSLAHWSIAQTNNFMKDIYEPATRGDIKPLLTGLFGAAIGGYLIKELRQDIQGKKSPIPSLSEIASSDRGLQGNKGLLAYNMMAAMTYAGFGGLLSQVAKYPFDFAYKNQPIGATFPLDEIATDTASTLRYVSETLANDPNVNYVDLAQVVAMHMLSTNFQMSRIAINQGINHGLITGLPAEKKELSDKLGQLRRFDMTEGIPYNDIDQGSNPYMNLEQKQFKMTQDIGQAVQELPSLVENILKTYGDKPDVMMSKLKALKENQYSTFPDMQTMPLSFMKYVGYLQRYEGPEAAQAELKDYMTHRITNEAKASVVP